MDIINKRRSVRSYLSTPVKSEDLEMILRAAMQAPSAKNQQPWRFLVVQNTETLKKLAEVSTNAKMLLEAPCAIIVIIDKTNLKTEMMAFQDASAATMNILLEATSLGLGTCWCGIYPNQERMDNLKSILKVNESYDVFSLIALGYPKDKDALYFIDRYNLNRIHYEKF